MNAITLTDPPAVVELKRKFRAFDEEEETLKAQIDQLLEFAKAALERVRLAKRDIARQIFNEEKPAAGRQSSPLALKLLEALRNLTKECEPHPCGGFTTDDMEWRMGVAFTGEEVLNGALDELLDAKLIRYAGFDEADAIGHCYSLVLV